jgi:hypothetical protein
VIIDFMKSVALVASHFVPSNLAAVHRSRLWSLYLAEFGWEPIIVTTHPRYYEEALEPELEKLVRAGLRVIQTGAIPTRPVRLIGDIGVRGFWWHRRALLELAERREIDFVHITIPANFSAPLGRMVKARTGVRYGIDYIDPWVHEFPGSRDFGTKAWASARLAEVLEPWCVREASLITGINEGYVRGTLERNAYLREQSVVAVMPYGGAASDHEVVRGESRDPFLFRGAERAFRLVYAGAMLPAAFPVLEALLRGLAYLKERNPCLAEVLRVFFIGTGKSPSDELGYNVMPLAEHYGVGDVVSERPHRIGYLDVLSHLEGASGVFVMGTTEAHYSPSKVYQSLMSGRPVLSCLHEESSAVSLMMAAAAGPVLTLTAGRLPSAEEMALALQSLMGMESYSLRPEAIKALEDLSARRSAQVLAGALDRAVLR